MAVLLALLLLAALGIALLGWNWLRAPLERQVLQRTGRVLDIQGDLAVNFSWPQTTVQAAQVTFANPAWALQPQMLKADGVAVSVDLPALLQRQVVFPQVKLKHATVFLERAEDGRKSWLLDLGQTNDQAHVLIGRLTLEQATLGYDDVGQKTSLRAELSTEPQTPSSDKLSGLRFTAAGRYKGMAVTAQGSGGSVLSLRDTRLPYPLTLDATVGRTVVKLVGTVTDLLTLTAVDMQAALRGDSLEQLFPLLGVAFPVTHAYTVQGHLLHTGASWRYEQFSGRIGASDIAGDVQVISGGKRPLLTAELHSKLLDLDDLAPTIGARPDVGAVAATPKSPASHVLPDLPFKAERWDSVDADVVLHATQLHHAKAWPLENLTTHLKLRDSVLTLDPLDFGLAGGELKTKVTLDGRQQPIQAHAQVSARKVLLAKLFPTVNLSKNSIGEVNGGMDLVGSGNSVGRMLASANGKMGLVVEGGQISKLMMEQVGLHLWEILSLNLTGDQLVKLRCAVAGFDVKQGKMQAKTLVFDTQVTTLLGTGSIDLGQETLDLTLNPKTKNTSPVALHSPIYVRGSFAQPKVDFDKTQVTARAAGAVVLGLINPLLALVPLIDAGPGKDIDCAALQANWLTH
jgi:AsmA protein